MRPSMFSICSTFLVTAAILALRSCREVCVCLWKASRASHMQGSWTISTFTSSHHSQTRNITEIPRKGWFELRVIITEQIIYPQLQSESYFIKSFSNYVTLCNTVYAMLFISEFLTTLWECYILWVYIDVESVFNWLNMSEIIRHWQMKLSDPNLF